MLREWQMYNKNKSQQLERALHASCHNSQHQLSTLTFAFRIAVVR